MIENLRNILVERGMLARCVLLQKWNSLQLSDYERRYRRERLCSWADQIGHSVAIGSPSLRRFFGAMYIAQALRRGDEPATSNTL